VHRIQPRFGSEQIRDDGIAQESRFGLFFHQDRQLQKVEFGQVQGLGLVDSFPIQLGRKFKGR